MRCNSIEDLNELMNFLKSMLQRDPRSYSLEIRMLLKNYEQVSDLLLGKLVPFADSVYNIELKDLYEIFRILLTNGHTYIAQPMLENNLTLQEHLRTIKFPDHQIFLLLFFLNSRELTQPAEFATKWINCIGDKYVLEQLISSLDTERNRRPRRFIPYRLKVLQQLRETLELKQKCEPLPVISNDMEVEMKGVMPEDKSESTSASVSVNTLLTRLMSIDINIPDSIDQAIEQVGTMQNEDILYEAVENLKKDGPTTETAYVVLAILYARIAYMEDRIQLKLEHRIAGNEFNQIKPDDKIRGIFSKSMDTFFRPKITTKTATPATGPISVRMAELK
jgi:hypothetical protein